VVRKRLHEILETGSDTDLPSKLFDYFILTMIMLNVLAVALETAASVAEATEPFLKYFEWFSIAVFTIEYVLRVWTCVEKRAYRSSVGGRVRFMLSPLAIIDALAVFPAYLGAFMPIDLRFVRVLRVFRLIRVFKLSRYNKASQVIGRILRAKRDELVMAGSIMLCVLVLASCVMYYVEHAAQPEAFSSIPATMWWSVATLTTVGYGDVVPVTVAGRFIGAMTSLLGIAFFALPAGILASGFSDVLGNKPTVCPKCGEPIVASGENARRGNAAREAEDDDEDD
jgi:voltage-gated potassium channel